MVLQSEIYHCSCSPTQMSCLGHLTSALLHKWIHNTTLGTIFLTRLLTGLIFSVRRTRYWQDRFSRKLPLHEFITKSNKHGIRKLGSCFLFQCICCSRYSANISIWFVMDQVPLGTFATDREQAFLPVYQFISISYHAVLKPESSAYTYKYDTCFGMLARLSRWFIKFKLGRQILNQAENSHWPLPFCTD